MGREIKLVFFGRSMINKSKVSLKGGYMYPKEKINYNEYVVGLSIQFTAAILQSGSQAGAELIGLEKAEALLYDLEEYGFCEFITENE